MYKYLIYGYLPKIGISTTYNYLVYGHLPKIKISYHGAPGRTYKYQIYG